MATYQVIESYPPFDYGSAVQWYQAGGTLMHGSICGFSIVNTPEQAIAFGVPLGTALALVEGASGDALEIPINALELV